MLKDIIKRRCSELDCTDNLLTLMGYRKNLSQASHLLEHVINDSELGLFSSNYDFKYSSREFLDALCAALDIDIKPYEKEIDEIHHNHEMEANRFRSYVFVDTNFKRENQPIFALALCSSQRYLYLPKEVQLSPPSEQIEYARRLVKGHYSRSRGELSIWGKIHRYVLVYSEREKVEISIDGTASELKEPLREYQATLHIR